MSHLATPLLFALAKDQWLLPSAPGPHGLTSPGPLLVTPSPLPAPSFIPFLVPAPFLSYSQKYTGREPM